MFERLVNVFAQVSIKRVLSRCRPESECRCCNRCAGFIEHVVLFYFWGPTHPTEPSLLSGGSRIFQMGGRCFVTNGGAHILFSGKKCMKLKEIGLKWGGARLLAPCYSKITIFL